MSVPMYFITLKHCASHYVSSILREKDRVTIMEHHFGKGLCETYDGDITLNLAMRLGTILNGLEMKVNPMTNDEANALYQKLKKFEHFL